ncbi:hypothetical protein GCM10023093_12460 [Nemorincola caseinilytica]|uniref:Uncharacterized protein n=1 Tax=Nemorincola caseinilytica TaxID=2054315 RepID=A0ABP8NCL2_9BACT
MKLIYPLFILLLVVLASCEKLGLCHDAEYHMHKTPYTGTQLRTDGFYYGEPDTDYVGVIRRTILVLYRNGVIMMPGSPKQDSMEHYLSQPGRKDVVYEWGLFAIDDTAISMENWMPAHGGCSPIGYTTGQILNDIAFVLTARETRRRKGKTERKEYNELYIFRPLADKPDSTNDILD